MKRGSNAYLEGGGLSELLNVALLAPALFMAGAQLLAAVGLGAMTPVSPSLASLSAQAPQAGKPGLCRDPLPCSHLLKGRREPDGVRLSGPVDSLLREPIKLALVGKGQTATSPAPSLAGGRGIITQCLQVIVNYHFQ